MSAFQEESKETVGISNPIIIIEEADQNQEDNVSNKSTKSEKTKTVVGEKIKENNYFNNLNEIDINSNIDDIYEFTVTELYRKLNQNEDIIFPGKKHRLSQLVVEYNKNGSRKTVWVNFRKICTEMDRKEDHVSKFIELDLKKSGLNIGSNGELRMYGRYDSMLGNCFDRYVRKYLICNSCGSIKTKFVENYNFNLDFVICQNCPEKRSVK